MSESASRSWSGDHAVNSRNGPAVTATAPASLRNGHEHLHCLRLQRRLQSKCHPVTALALALATASPALPPRHRPTRPRLPTTARLQGLTAPPQPPPALALPLLREICPRRPQAILTTTTTRRTRRSFTLNHLNNHLPGGCHFNCSNSRTRLRLRLKHKLCKAPSKAPNATCPWPLQFPPPIWQCRCPAAPTNHTSHIHTRGLSSDWSTSTGCPLVLSTILPPDHLPVLVHHSSLPPNTPKVFATAPTETPELSLALATARDLPRTQAQGLALQKTTSSLPTRSTSTPPASVTPSSSRAVALTVSVPIVIVTLRTAIETVPPLRLRTGAQSNPAPTAHPTP